MKWSPSIRLAFVASLLVAGGVRLSTHTEKSGSVQAGARREAALTQQTKPGDCVKLVTHTIALSETEQVHLKEAAGQTEENSTQKEDAVLKQIEAGIELSEIPATLDYLRNRHGESNAEELALLLVRQWAEQDVEAVAKWLGGSPSDPLQKEAVKHVAIVWALKDVPGALNWIGQLTEGEVREGALLSAGYEIVRTDPLVAMEIAVQLPVEKKSDALLQHAALQWAAIDPESAAHWAKALPEATLKERVQANIATAWGERDPALAAQYAVLGINPGRAQEDAVIAVVQRWVQRAPEAAASWVQDFPEGLLAETAAENIIKLWPGGFSD